MNNQNRVRQVIKLEDGSKKVIFHNKKFHDPKYGNRKAWWDHLNTTKRQK